MSREIKVPELVGGGGGASIATPPCPTLTDIIKRIEKTLTSKGGEYKDSVISVLPRGDWLSQIVIKANRAQRAVSDEKLKDELLDTACYCILLLEKIERENYRVHSNLGEVS